MLMGRVALPKCLPYDPTQIEKDQCTIIEQSVHLVLLKLALTNNTQLYN